MHLLVSHLYNYIYVSAICLLFLHPVALFLFFLRHMLTIIAGRFTWSDGGTRADDAGDEDTFLRTIRGQI